MVDRDESWKRERDEKNSRRKGSKEETLMAVKSVFFLLPTETFTFLIHSSLLFPPSLTSCFLALFTYNSVQLRTIFTDDDKTEHVKTVNIERGRERDGSLSIPYTS